MVNKSWSDKNETNWNPLSCHSRRNVCQSVEFISHIQHLERGGSLKAIGQAFCQSHSEQTSMIFFIPLVRAGGSWTTSQFHFIGWRWVTLPWWAVSVQPVTSKAKTYFLPRKAFTAVLWASLNKEMLSSWDQTNNAAALNPECCSYGRPAAAASCFCHKWKVTDWLRDVKGDWQGFRLELFKMDALDSRLEISAIQLNYKVENV